MVTYYQAMCMEYETRTCQLSLRPLSTHQTRFFALGRSSKANRDIGLGGGLRSNPNHTYVPNLVEGHSEADIEGWDRAISINCI